MSRTIVTEIFREYAITHSIIRTMVESGAAERNLQLYAKSYNAILYLVVKKTQLAVAKLQNQQIDFDGIYDEFKKITIKHKSGLFQQVKSKEKLFAGL